MSKAQAARTFSVSLSSVKRYANKASRGESLAPKKSPGSAPKLDEKTRKLLEDDLREVVPLPPFKIAVRLYTNPNGALGESLHHMPRHSQDRSD